MRFLGSVDKHFEKLRHIVADKTVSSRARFACEDLLELRARNWGGRGGPEATAARSADRSLSQLLSRCSV